MRPNAKKAPEGQKFVPKCNGNQQKWLRHKMPRQRTRVNLPEDSASHGHLRFIIQTNKDLSRLQSSLVPEGGSEKAPKPCQLLPKFAKTIGKCNAPIIFRLISNQRKIQTPAGDCWVTLAARGRRARCSAIQPMPNKELATMASGRNGAPSGRL
jgi:hypothetical protein